jgi:hypothetical protein
MLKSHYFFRSEEPLEHTHGASPAPVYHELLYVQTHMVRTFWFVLGINYRSAHGQCSWSLARLGSGWANSCGWRTSDLLDVQKLKPVAQLGRVHDAKVGVNHRE